jgi:hypothetical protein
MQKLNQLQSYLKDTFPKESTTLLFIFSLCCELLILLYLFFFFLWTTETLLPGFISFRVSLAPYFAVLLGATFGLSLLGEYLNLSFPKMVRFHKAFLTMGLLWGIIIITISLIDFPWWSIIGLLCFFIFVVYYFYNTFLQYEQK